MTSKTTIGLEQEFLLIDKEGYVQNVADEIINDPANNQICVAEATYAQVEVNSAPAHTISELEHDLRTRFRTLEDLCAKYRVFPLPASEFGAKSSISRGGKARYDIYETILGKENNEKTNTISGIHIHLSRIPGFELEQFWILQALDSLSYALTSTSPFRYDGVNSLNCHRVNIVRNDAFIQFPLHSKLQEYPKSVQDLERGDRNRYTQWQKASNLSECDFSLLFCPENTGYAPIRTRPSIGPTGTYEIRTCDTTPLNIALGISALYKGIVEALAQKTTPIAISQDNSFSVFPTIKLPSLQTLHHLEKIAIEHGMENNEIRSYAEQAIRLAHEGLPNEDQKYLQSIKEIIMTEQNPATQLINHMKNKGKYSSRLPLEARADANLFIRSLYQKSLQQ